MADKICDRLYIAFIRWYLLNFDPDWGHYKIMGGVRLSVCLFVACFDLTRERKGLGNPKLAGWKPITWVTQAE